MDEIPDRAIADGNAAFGEVPSMSPHAHLELGRDPLKQEPAPFSNQSAGPMAPHLPTRGAARSRCDQRTTLATLTVKIVATASHAVSRRDPFCNSLPKIPMNRSLVILASLRPPTAWIGFVAGAQEIPKPVETAKPDHALVTRLVRVHRIWMAYHVSSPSLEAAIRHLCRYGDTDIFPIYQN